MNEYVSLMISPSMCEPCTLCFDLDTWNKGGVKEIKITCNGNDYILSKNCIENFLKHNAIVCTKEKKD